MTDRESAEFGKLAVALGFLTREDLEKAVRLQADMERVGVSKRLGEILLEKKIVSREHVLLILRAQGKRILTCRQCKKSYNVHHYRPTETYACKHCTSQLELPLKPVEPGVNDSVIFSSTELRRKTTRPAHAAKASRSKVPKEFVHLLSGYEMTDTLGQGGMGTVYKARDLIGGRWVAVKLLAPFLARDEEYVKRFFIEAKNLQKLHHPNIVAAYDAGIAGEHKFFIMEYVDGPSLEHVIEKRGKLREHTALEIARQIAQALDYAWRRKIIHRDIKPQNIMLTHERRVKLCDLGLSKDVTSDISLTMTGSVNCSPPYASPEQAQGFHDIDCRSDVYSLGVSLFQMLCGELPFKGRSPGQFLIQHVTKTPPDPASKNSSISPTVNTLILRMLEKAPKDRPDPAELEKILTRLLNAREAKVSGSAGR